MCYIISVAQAAVFPLGRTVTHLRPSLASTLVSSECQQEALLMGADRKAGEKGETGGGQKPESVPSRVSCVKGHDEVASSRDSLLVVCRTL